MTLLKRSVSLQIVLGAETASWRDDLEILINAKCRIVCNYSSRYPYTKSMKYGRTTDFIPKYINPLKPKIV
jgi:hypothetical protein